MNAALRFKLEVVQDGEWDDNHVVSPAFGEILICGVHMLLWCPHIIVAVVSIEVNSVTCNFDEYIGQ